MFFSQEVDSDEFLGQYCLVEVELEGDLGGGGALPFSSSTRSLDRGRLFSPVLPPLSDLLWTSPLQVSTVLVFLSAAQPTDQGEESVVLVVVVWGGHFSSSHVQFFGV